MSPTLSRYDRRSRWRRRADIPPGVAYCFVVYRYPFEMRGGFIARAFAVRPEGLLPMDCLGGGTISQVRGAIPSQASRCLKRAPDDAPVIFETWF
jgi:hypothetical protein